MVLATCQVITAHNVIFLIVVGMKPSTFVAGTAPSSRDSRTASASDVETVTQRVYRVHRELQEREKAAFDKQQSRAATQGTVVLPLVQGQSTPGTSAGPVPVQLPEAVDVTPAVLAHEISALPRLPRSNARKRAGSHVSKPTGKHTRKSRGLRRLASVGLSDVQYGKYPGLSKKYKIVVNLVQVHNLVKVIFRRRETPGGDKCVDICRGPRNWNTGTGASG
jgi:hypothetical protein